MQGNLFFTDESKYPLEYFVETIDDSAPVKELKYYSGTSDFGNYVAVFTKTALVELEFTDDEETYLADVAKRYPEVKIAGAKAWELAKKIFTPAKYATIPQVNVALQGTEFQLKVWNELLKIPFGQTVLYDDIALKLGDKNASRAVGSAVGQNRIAFLVPCHRVVAKNGKLSNFRWGTERKRQLLEWEGSFIY